VQLEQRKCRKNRHVLIKRKWIRRHEFRCR
jgi:hypothetical protein